MTQNTVVRSVERITRIKQNRGYKAENKIQTSQHNFEIMQSDPKRRKIIDEQIARTAFLPNMLVARIFSFLTLKDLRYACYANERIAKVCEDYKLIDRARDYEGGTMYVWGNWGEYENINPLIVQTPMVVAQNVATITHLKTWELGYITVDDDLIRCHNLFENREILAPFVQLAAEEYYVTEGGELFWIGPPRNAINMLQKVVQIDYHDDLLAFVTEDGSGYMLGTAQDGRAGTGLSVDVVETYRLPEKVIMFPQLEKIIFLDFATTCFITQEGQLYISGMDLRDPDIVHAEPVLVDDIEPIQHVTHHGYMLTRRGTLIHAHDDVIEPYDTGNLVVSQVASTDNAVVILTPEGVMHINGVIPDVFDSHGVFVQHATNVTQIMTDHDNIVSYLVKTHTYPHGDGEKYLLQIDAKCITCGIDQPSFVCTTCDAIFCGVECGAKHKH